MARHLPVRRGLITVGLVAAALCFVVAITFRSADEASEDGAGDRAEPATAASSADRPAPTTTAPRRATTRAIEARKPDSAPNPGRVYEDRPDIRDGDHEREIGTRPVRFGGYSVSVLSAEYAEQASENECCGYMRVRVRILNRGDAQRFWARVDFSLRHPSGDAYPPTLVLGAEDALWISGVLAHGVEVEGDLWFNVDPDIAARRYFLYWQPSSMPSEDERGVWGIQR